MWIRIPLLSISLLLCSVVILRFSPLRSEPVPLVPEPAPVVEVSLEEPSEPDYEVFEVTAYCDSGITRSGAYVKRGIVAADPSTLPIGSVIEVEAGRYSGIYTVLDTGSAVKGQIIDIYMPSYEEAIEFGRQCVKVRVLRHGWHSDPSDAFSSGIAG